MKSTNVLYGFLRSGFMLLCLMLLGIGFATHEAHASIANTIGYQGRLKNSAGTALTSTFTFTFRLYSASSGGTALWTEVQPSISTSDGFFAVRLGSVTAFPVAFDFNQPLYLAIEVNSDGEMSPRVIVNSVPFAFTAGGIGSEVTQPASATGGRMYYNSASGTLNYYDAFTSAWRSLGTGSGTGTLQTTTDSGSVTTNAITFAGGTSTAGFTFQAGVTSSNLFVSGTVSTTQLRVGGFLACLSNGTNCPSSLTEVDTLATVAARGSFATSTLSLYGGFVGSSSTVTSTLTVVGNTTLSTFTATSGTATSLNANTASVGQVTSTVWLGFATASGTTLNASAISVNGSAVCLANGTNCASSASTDTLALVTARGSFATSTLQLYGGFVGSSSTVTSTLTVLGNSALNTATVGHVTSTVWLGFATASGTTLNSSAVFVNGSAVCLANGTNCLSQAPASTSTLAEVTARGSSATTTLQLYGGFVGSSSTVTSTFTVLGSTSLQNVTTGNLVGSNATFTSATTTNLFFTNSSGTTLNASAIFVNGSATCLANGTNCPATSNDTLAAVTARGSSATSTLLLYGGFVGSSSTVTSTLTVLGNTTLSTLTAAQVTSTAWFGFATASGTTLNSSAVFVNGSAVCLANGTNCLSQAPASTSTLAEVTARGSSATSTLQLYGGFVGSSSTVTSTFTVLGSTSLQNFTGVNATLTTATTTNLFFTNASGSLLNASAILVNGSNVCLANGTNCPSSLTEVDTLATVTARGSSATTTLQLYGGFVGSSSTVTSTFTVLGSTSLQNLTGANATFTSATTTNLFFTNASGSLLNASAILVNGSNVCLANGTNCPSSLTEVDTLATVTARGSSATTTLQLYGGFVGSSSTVTSTFTVLGSTSLQNLTGANATFTSATTTNLFFTNASGSLLNASSILVNGSNVCLANGTNCPSSLTEVDTLATVTARGSFATSTLQLYGGFVGSSSTVTSTFTVLGDTSLQNVTTGNLVGSNATFTNATTTAFFATNFQATNGSVTNLTLTNATSGWIGATTVSTTNLFVGGFMACLSNGTSCPAAASADTLAAVTARGSFATSTLQLYGGFVGSSSTVTSTFTVLGSTSLQNLTGANATFTSATTTNLFFTNASGSLLNASAILVNGSNVCLANGTNCPSSLTEVDTLATVSARGSFATSTLQLYGGFVGSSSTVTSTFTVLGSTSLQNLTGANATFTSATTTNLFFTNASGSLLNASAILVNGSNVCLANGTNCPSSLTEVDTLATVSARGSFATSTLQLYGGFVGSSSTVTSTLTVLGSTSLQNLTGANATFTSATTTNLFFTNASGSFLIASAILVNGSNVCLANGTNCPSSLTEVDTLATVSARGSFATSTLQLYGGFVGSSSTVTSTFTVLGSTSLQNLTGANATFTSATTTNLFFTNASGSTLNASAIFVNGSATCLANGTNCPVATSNDTLAIVTARGSFATSTLQLYGGFVGSSSTVTSTFTVLGDTSLQNTTLTTLVGTNATFTNATTTAFFATNFQATNGSVTNLTLTNATSGWIGATTVSTTNLFVGGFMACLSNGTNCPATASADTLAAVTARGSFATSTLQLYGGFVGSSSTVTSTFTVLGSTSLQNVTTGNLIGSNATFTNATTTAFFATNLQSTNGSITNLTLTNATSGWIGATTVSTTNLFVGGFLACLSNGTNCPATASADTLAAVTARGSFATSTLQLYGGFVGSSSTVTSTFTVLGDTSLQNLIGVNATFTAVSSTSFFVTSAGLLNASTTNFTVRGQLACLADGTNCPVAVTGIETLATVTARGSFATSTLQFYGGFVGASSTVTSTFTVLGLTSLQDVTAANATFTSATTTNFFFTSASGSTLNASTIRVNGQDVCLEDRTNCPDGIPNIKTATSTATFTLTTAEQEVIVVTSTPSVSTSQMWISYSVVLTSDSNTDRNIGFTLHRDAQGCAGTIVGYTVTTTLDTPSGSSDTMSFSFVDSPATSTALAYHLCVQTSTGSPTVNRSSMSVEEVKFGADLGEVYYTQDSTLGPREVVKLDSTMRDGVMRATSTYDSLAVGVVSSYPGKLLSQKPLSGGRAVIVALVGRTEVYASNENGVIAQGDPLTSASLDGYVMKATGPGPIVGRAMENVTVQEWQATSTATGTIMMFVQPSFYIPSQNGQLFTETLTAHQYLQVGVDGIPAVGPSAIAQFQGTTNTYLQVNLQNLSDGDSASSDYIATADNGDDSSYYIDLGINGSGYSNPDFTINGPNDGYVYVHGGDLTIGTASSAANVVFHTGGTLAGNERMRLTDTGLGIGTINITNALEVAGTVSTTALRVGGLTFTNATGVNVTTTNLKVTGSVSTTGSVFHNAMGTASAGDDAVCLSSTGELRKNTGSTSCLVSSQVHKHNIADLTSALDTVMQLRPVSFNWNYNNASSVGFIAEEVGLVDPRLVNTVGTTTVGVRYELITSVLAGAIQEHQNRIASFQQSVTTTNLEWANATGTNLSLTGRLDLAGLGDCDDPSSKVIYDATSGRFACATDRASASLRKTVDESVATSTMQSDDELVFAAGTNETWIFRYTLQGNAPSSAGFSFAVDAPTDSTCDVSVIDPEGAVSVANLSCGEASGAIAGTDSDKVYEVLGSIVTSGTTGNVTLRWAKAADAGADATIKSGSSLVAFKVSGADLAEAYFTKDASLVPGTVVALDPSLPAGVKRSESAYDNNLLGVISEQPGLVVGDAIGSSKGLPVLLALAGRVPVMVTADNGAIRPGDYLTSSDIPGVAQKSTKPGASIGQALTAFDGSGIGRVMLFVKMGDVSKQSLTRAKAATRAADRLGAVLDAVKDSRGKEFTKEVWENGLRSDLLVDEHQAEPVEESTDTKTAVVVNTASSFQGSVVIKGHINAGRDTAGQAVIRSGDTRVTVTFETPYEFQPIVTVTPLDFLDNAYRVTDITTASFIIQLSQPPSNDKRFNWHVLGGGESRVFISDGTIEDVRIVTPDGNSITPVPEPTPVVESEPEPVVEPDPVVQPEPTPDPVVEPDPIVQPEPTPDPAVEPVPASIVPSEPTPDPVVEPSPVVEPEPTPIVEPIPDGSMLDLEAAATVSP